MVRVVALPTATASVSVFSGSSSGPKGSSF